jgi:hypothetical protein
VGVAEGTLKGWCYAIGLSPRRTLMLARLLRSVARQRLFGDHPMDSLELLDRRTSRAWSLLVFGSTAEVLSLPASEAELLWTQRLVTDPVLLQRIALQVGVR